MIKKSTLFVVYALIDPRTNCIRYIGRTNNIKNRFYGHKNRALALKDKLGPNEHLYNWFNVLLDLGLEPVISLLEENIEEKDINNREIYWITHYRTKTDLVNQNDGGKGFGLNNKVWLGKKHTEETKKKMSESGTGRIVSEETRKKLSISNKGKFPTAEIKEKISKAVKASLTSESKYKMGASFRGKNLSKEHKIKISESNLGKVYTEETKKKMSIAQKGKKYSPEFVDKMSGFAPTSIKVEQYTLEGEFIKQFPSIRRIAKELGNTYNRFKIKDCCENAIPSYKNYIWKFSQGEK